MIKNKLVITINDANKYYSLYADGLLLSKTYDKEIGITELTYNENEAVFLYYTYPAHRRVYLIRNTQTGKLSVLPGLSNEVNIIFKHIASRVDKTRRVVSFLNEHFQNAYRFTNDFYLRLDCLIAAKGKLNYLALNQLVENEIKTANAPTLER
ncbi:hypothetical protein FACS1894190_10220 [Spirochaetia bacterium]|nr:hypothetical protein FACS1894190_10220 [Spirochaetia bacterium]